MRPYVLSMCVFVWTFLWCLVFVWKWLFSSHGGKDGTGEIISLYVHPLTFIITFFPLSLSVRLWHLSFCLPGNHINLCLNISGKKNTGKMFHYCNMGFIGLLTVFFFFSFFSFRGNIPTIIQ